MESLPIFPPRRPAIGRNIDTIIRLPVLRTKVDTSVRAQGLGTSRRRAAVQ